MAQHRRGETAYTITVASPEGGDLAADTRSDPGHASGCSAHDILSLGFKHAAHAAKRRNGTALVVEALGR